MEVMEPCTGWHPPDGSAAWRESVFLVCRAGKITRMQQSSGRHASGQPHYAASSAKNGFVYCGVIHLAKRAPRLAFERAAVVPGGENPGVNPGMTNPNGMNPGGAYAGMPNANGMNPEGHMQGAESE